MSAFSVRQKEIAKACGKTTGGMGAVLTGRVQYVKQLDLEAIADFFNTTSEYILDGTALHRGAYVSGKQTEEVTPEAPAKVESPREVQQPNLAQARTTIQIREKDIVITIN